MHAHRARAREELKFQRWLSGWIASKLRSRLRAAIKKQSGLKSDKTLALLGCSAAKFKRHIEAQFKSGMDWSNHGAVWHLDHIRPCCSFDLSSAKQQKRCFNYKNIQPLFVLDNLKKGGRYTSKSIAHQSS